MSTLTTVAEELAPDVPNERVLVRDLHSTIADRLAAHLRTSEGEAVPRDKLTARLITEALDEYTAKAMASGRPPLPPAVEQRVVRILTASLLGAGGLQLLLDDDSIEDIHINGCDVVWVRRVDGSTEPVAPVTESDDALVDLVRGLAARSGVQERRWDRAAPILDLRLPDGSRLHAVMAVAARPSVSIRRHRYTRITLAELVELGTMTPAVSKLLAAAVRARWNILVAGRTGAGKTTMLRALAAAIDPGERIVTIEDSYELALDANAITHPNVVALQVREANIEGEGAVDASTLFRAGLRMGPDRVIVGEVRGHEVIPMLNAMSQGNDGSLGTIHASSSSGVFAKLALYAAQSPERLAPSTTNLLIAEAVDLIVHLGMTADGRRLVTSVREVLDADADAVASNEILRISNGSRNAIAASPMSAGRVGELAAYGFNMDRLHEEAMG